MYVCTLYITVLTYSLIYLQNIKNWGLTFAQYCILRNNNNAIKRRLDVNGQLESSQTNQILR